MPFHFPDISEDEIRAVVETLRSGWLTTGPQVKRFEEEFAKLTGIGHAIALNSGTAALHLGLDAVGVSEGDDVILPTMTFAATAEVVIHLKAKPVLVDSQRDTINMAPDEVDKAITAKTKAIIAVHYAGQPCDMDEILEIAHRYNLAVIEDAAHALPARYKGRMVGRIGNLTCFSFYATKTITTGEGGMVTTGRGEWAERIRMMSLHGISKDAWRRYTAEGSWYYEIEAPGFKYNLTDIAASIGLAQLRKCELFWRRRCEIADAYTKGFSDCNAIRIPELRPDRSHAWHLYVIQLNLEHLRIDRGRFIEEMKARNIGASVHFMPLHLHPYYRKSYGFKVGQFPVAEECYKRCLSLPIYPGMTDGDVEDVVAAVLDVVETYRR